MELTYIAVILVIFTLFAIGLGIYNRVRYTKDEIRKFEEIANKNLMSNKNIKDGDN